MSRRLKLTHVLVQPYFVADEGETAEVVDHPPVKVNARAWPAWATAEEGFRELVRKAQAELDQLDANR